MKAYVCMVRTIHLITSGTMEKVRKIIVITKSMHKTVLKQTIATLARSEAKSPMKFRNAIAQSTKLAKPIDLSRTAHPQL